MNIRENELMWLNVYRNEIVQQLKEFRKKHGKLKPEDRIKVISPEISKQSDQIESAKFSLGVRYSQDSSSVAQS